jgi:hypothetical protein
MRPAGGGWPSTRKDTEITAGVPGLGLSGLFVLLSGLVLPLARRRRGPRGPVARLFGLAVIMTAAIIVTWEMIFGAAALLHTAVPAPPLSGTPDGHGPWRLPIIAVSVSIMLLVIATGEVLLHLVGARPTPTPPPIEAALPVELPRGRHERRSRPTQGVPAGRP